ncbi:hypothetical protein H6F67_25185 [Microcoleus sp. FACHB-1515]|uniref:hypothetical protein n=1 Tax=Cyanophyceae TaxID=3028117 RepID=UPI001684B309|nr:hypothetical protein [Microcoleus sp. FACHB-1515]MBD2093143.1 hypothetical protein [Microcoleus sp. FACHB-1515]
MNIEDSRSNERSDSPTPEIRSTTKIKGDKRTPIKHILIGTPEIVEFTTRRLDQLGYAEAIEWARPLNLNEPLNIVPDPGDVISLLVRYLSIGK